MTEMHIMVFLILVTSLICLNTALAGQARRFVGRLGLGGKLQARTKGY